MRKMDALKNLSLWFPRKHAGYDSKGLKKPRGMLKDLKGGHRSGVKLREERKLYLWIKRCAL